MLQQTRAQAAIPYYERFLARFPGIAELARAEEPQVLEAWSGLGYYSRARNLLRAARLMAADGGFPSDYESIRRLPGIGDYTAAAIASIAFGLPHAAVDGNVLRVVARVSNDAGEIGSAATRARFRQRAEGWLDRLDPGTFNQAMMELGATVCLPRQPRCPACPVALFCAAREAGTAAQLPIKLRKSVPRDIEMTVAVVEKRGSVLMRQRVPEDRRMAGFWELPEVGELAGFEALAVLGTVRHTITHHRYRIAVVRGRVRRAPRGFRWLSSAERSAVPVSTIARKALALLW